MKLIIVSLILLVTNLAAQDVEVGFRLETAGLHTTSSNGESKFAFGYLPTSVYLTAGVYPMEKLCFEGRFGRELVFDNYIGFEYELFAKYFINNYLYAVCGIAYHANEHNGGRLSFTFKNNLAMPALGIGVKPFKHFGIEAIFMKANNSSIGGDLFPISGDRYDLISQQINWAFKLGYAFSWKL